MANEETLRTEEENVAAAESASAEQGEGAPETAGSEAEASAPESVATEDDAIPTMEAPDVESLIADVVTLQAQVEEQKDAVLRAQAEAQNVRRRSERDVENAHKFALEKFSSDLLPIIDSLERALDAADNIEDEAVKGMQDGVALTLKMFVDALNKHGVEQIDPAGEPFNPEFHQAMSMVPNPELKPNSVMAVMQKGYLLHGRLVRPAMVVVSKAP